VSEPSGTSTAASTPEDGATGASLFSGFRSQQAEAAQSSDLTAAFNDEPEPSPVPDEALVPARAQESDLPVPDLDPTSVTFLDSAESVDGWYDPTTGESTDAPETVGADWQPDQAEAWDQDDTAGTEPESDWAEPGVATSDVGPDEYVSDPPAFAEAIPASDHEAVPVDLASIPEPWSPAPAEFDQVSEVWTPESETSEFDSPEFDSPAFETSEFETPGVASSEPAAWSAEPISAEPASWSVGPDSEPALPEPWVPQAEPVSSESESWSPAAGAWAPEPVMPEAESWSPEPVNAESAQVPSESEAESWSAEPWVPQAEPVSSESESWSPAAGAWAPEPVVSEPWSPEPEIEPEIASWSAEPVESETESWSASEPATQEAETASWSAEPGASETEPWSPEPAATQAQSWSPEPEPEPEPWTSESASQEQTATPVAPTEMRSELSQTLTASIDILPARTTFRTALSRGRRKNDAAGAEATPFNGGFDPIAPAREFALREGFGSDPDPEQEPTSGGLPAELTNIPVSPISRVPEPSQPRDVTGALIERRQHPRTNDGPRQGGRSALASEALTELSRLSSYSPTSMPTGRAGLQRRTPSDVPVQEQQPVESGGRARTAASVRSMLAGFKAGVERGRTSPSANRPASDREPPQPPQPRESR
jgi:hypothetical protein